MYYISSCSAAYNDIVLHVRDSSLLSRVVKIGLGYIVDTGTPAILELNSHTHIHTSAFIHENTKNDTQK